MNFKNYLQRAELISLQNFIKNGGECFFKTPTETYSERLKTAMNNANDFFNKKFTDIRENDEVTGYFYEQLEVFEDVFFEIGVIVGAKIGIQLQSKINELS